MLECAGVVVPDGDDEEDQLETLIEDPRGRDFQRIAGVLRAFRLLARLNRHGDVERLRQLREGILRRVDARTALAGFRLDDDEAIEVLSIVACIATFLSSVLNADGGLDQLRTMFTELTRVSMEGLRADVVSAVARSLRVLYDALPASPVGIAIDFPPHEPRHRRRVTDWSDPRPARTLAEIDAEDAEEVGSVADELQESLAAIDSCFSSLDRAVVVDLLRRGEPTRSKHLRAPYIAAALSLHATAFGHAVEEGESFDSAARRISNIFRNAATRRAAGR